MMEQPAAACESIAALEQAGAQQRDPLRMHYIRVLAGRVASHDGAVKRLLEAKLNASIADLAQRLGQSQCAASVAPGIQKDLHESPLAGLTRRLARHTPTASAGASSPISGLRPELHAVRQFRNTWSQLSVDKQVAQALGQAPKNAGPINSHMLVLRSLELMRSISPDYLNRFMTYADTLLVLDHSERSTPRRDTRRQA